MFEKKKLNEEEGEEEEEPYKTRSLQTSFRRLYLAF